MVNTVAYCLNTQKSVPYTSLTEEQKAVHTEMTGLVGYALLDGTLYQTNYWIINLLREKPAMMMQDRKRLYMATLFQIYLEIEEVKGSIYWYGRQGSPKVITLFNNGMGIRIRLNLTKLSVIDSYSINIITNNPRDIEKFYVGFKNFSSKILDIQNKVFNKTKELLT